MGNISTPSWRGASSGFVQWLLTSSIALFTASGMWAQGPNCGALNASVDVDGYAFFEVNEFVTNCGTVAEPVTLTITNGFGGLVGFYVNGGGPYTSADVNCVDEISLYVCDLISQELKLNVSNAGGACWAALTFKQSNGPLITCYPYWLWCLDPQVSDPYLFIDWAYGDGDGTYEPDVDYKDDVVIPCVGDGLRADFVADWVDPHDCVLGDDTAKVIYREFEAFDKEGRRGSCFDTIYVWRLPQITPDNIYCSERDTVYCGVGSAGPYMVVPELDKYTGMATGCDTLYFLDIDTEDGMLVFEPNVFDSKCGVQVHVDAWKFEDHCNPQYKVDIEVKQTCYGMPSTCVVDPIAMGPGTANAFEEISPGYWRCSFWITDLDTVPPLAECKYDKLQEQNVAWSYDFEDDDHNINGGNVPIHCFITPPYPGAQCNEPVIIVNTGTHDCAAHTYIPPVCVYDDWSGVKAVKASIAGIGTWSLEASGEDCDELDTSVYPCDPDYNVTGECWESHQQIKLPKTGDGYPYQILYEIYDYCHNIDSIYCYILVKDQVKPVAVADKGVNVSITDKKVWVDAETFDEGSWDNCGVNLLLARRADWYEACIDLCDDIEWCCAGPHGDTLYMAFLDRYKDGSDHDFYDEVEAHYAKTMQWLREDGQQCGDIIYNSWLYDLMKYATLKCIDHPYPVDNQYFRHIFEQCYADWLHSKNGFEEAELVVNGGHESSIFNDLHHDPSNKYDHADHDHYGDYEDYCFDYFEYVNPFLTPGCDNHFGNEQVVALGNGTNGNGGPYELTPAEKSLVDMYEQIGGGWSDAVPFSCEDACGPVTVEILVMDYWCNWSKAWTDVWVEDKTPVSVEKDVVDGTIYCATYKSARYDYPGEVHPVSLEYIVDQAKGGEQDAFDLLDEILGGYCKAWVDPYGNYVDENWEEIDCDITFSDSTCYCSSYYEQVRVYDEHFGYQWVDVKIDTCYFEEVEKDFQKGIIAVNCAENVFCEQEVWCEFDHCGQGYIFRKWKIWQGCPPQEGYGGNHIPDTIFRHQKIFVGNECAIQKGMFDVPYDTEVYSCGVEYDPDGSGHVVGDAGPENTGYPVYRFDDDCRLVGIAHDDKVFKIVGGDAACYKIIRTWYFADWCTDGPPSKENWWNRYGYDFSCEQKILVIDTMPPVCTVTSNVVDGLAEVAGGCYYTYEANVDVADPCGVIEYYWELKDIKKDPAEVIASGNGTLDGVEDAFSVTVEDLGTGLYKFVAHVTDECQNESYCEEQFEVVAGKKPAAVCITSITAELTPMDLDQDGEIDTAMAVVWAEEFNSSSMPACDDDFVDFYIEFIDGDGDDSLDTSEDLDKLDLGCEHIGTHTVRMWVQSESGTADFCDVLLIVQNNMGGCGDISGANNVTGRITTELGDNVEQVEVTAQLENGQELNWITNASGAYGFAAALGTKVIVTPKKDIGDDNGVSTLDLVKIQKHILGKALLETPLREVAADANNDGKVSTLDLIEIRKLILGKADQFANVDSWRFFANDNNVESYEVDPINNPMVIDWTGVKIGDVNNSMDPSRSADRSGKSLVFNVDNVELVAGNQYRVEFKADNFTDITGYQFTLNYDANAMRVVSFEGGALDLTEDNFGLNRMAEGLVTTSWNVAEGITVDQDEVVFTLVVEALNAAELSDVVTVNSRVTAAEAYNSADQIHGVSLHFEAGAIVEGGFALYQNEPNPFRENTLVGFNLPEAMSASVTVYDVTGKVLKVVDGDYGKGYNEVTFKRSDLNTTGVLYYQLDTEAFTATKKMIVIE